MLVTGSEFYDRRGGKYVKEDKGNKKRGKTCQISLLFSKTQLVVIDGMNMENLSNVEALNLSIKEHLAQKDQIKGLCFTLYFT